MGTFAPFSPRKHDETCRCGCQALLPLDVSVPPDHCRVCTKELESDGSCFECRGPLDAIRQRWEPQWIPDDSRWRQAREDVQTLLAEVDRQAEALRSVSRNFGCPECNSAKTAQEAIDG